MSASIPYRIYRKIRRLFAEHVLYGRFPYAYAHYYYWETLQKNINYRNPKDINEKMFWLARYWQSPLVVHCADKLAVRNYIKDLGLDWILNEIYFQYNKAEEIDFNALPSRFVLKCNHCGGGTDMVICKDKNNLDLNAAREIIRTGLDRVIGLPTCEYQYQYITPKAFAEKYIGDANDERLEIQFFCFNGKARHILLRNDLGDAAKESFAISYDLNWNRVHDRKIEDMSINIPRPDRLDEMIEIANTLAAPFPQVRVDLYYVNNDIIFGEMTFSTSGNILWNYTDEVRVQWGKELILPDKLKTKWKNSFNSHK